MTARRTAQEQVDENIVTVAQAAMAARYLNLPQTIPFALQTSGYAVFHSGAGTLHYMQIRGADYRYVNQPISIGTSSKADRRAKVLLYKTIGKSRYRAYVRHKRLDVQGSVSGIWYRLRDGHMIDIIDGKHKGSRLCIGSAIPVPGTDNLIAQLLMVTGDEKRLWKEANYWPSGGGGGKPLGHWK